MATHYANLTRGLICPCLPDQYNVTRIQSTHCERKQWASVITDAGPQLLYDLALGKHVIVHDISEKPRETRAMWQGLQWLRYACERSWSLSLTPFAGRCITATNYFANQYKLLDRPTRRFIDYYSKYVTKPFVLESCYAI